MSWGDDDYSEHAHEFVADMLSQESNAEAFLSIEELVEWLQNNAPGALIELQSAAARHPNVKVQGRGVRLFADGVIEVFSRQDWLRLGTLANCRSEILGHDRLLRSMDFGDDDYAGHAVQMIWKILTRQDDNYKLFGRFPRFLAWLKAKNPALLQRLFPEQVGVKPAQPATTAGHAPPTAPVLAPAPAVVSPPAMTPPPPADVAKASPADAPSGGDGIETLHDLLNAVTDISPGKADATAFHRAIVALLSELFEGELADPLVEDKLHGGLKRVDVTYTNRAKDGFFEWLSRFYPPCPNIFVECKNYSSDPKNPEVDQLAGRFSDNRGRFGLLVCRTVEDRDRVWERCKAQFNDNRNYIIILEDSDFADLVGLIASEGRSEACFQFLKKRLDELVK